jgi:ADP-ribose pyrophosphatase YjhB (NUDIX family)
MNTKEENFQAIFCSIDPVVFSIIDEKLHILLYKRNQEPHKDSWALPGGLIRPQEDNSLEQSVNRVLKLKTGMEVSYVEQLCSLGGFRDVRGWTLSVAYIALVTKQEVNLNSQWISVENLKDYKLAFDHQQIIETGLKRLTDKTNYSTLPIHFLETNFTLPQLQKVYEVFLGKISDKSTFRKKIEATGLLKETGQMFTGGAFRPAKLYTLAQNSKIVNFEKNMV